MAYIPSWPPWVSLSHVVSELSRHYTYTIAALLRMLLRQVMPNPLALAIPRTTGRILFLASYLWIGVRLWQRRLTLAHAGFLVYFVYLLANPSYRIWYPLWLVPLAALELTPRTRLQTFLFSLTSELSILMFYLVWRWLLNGQVLPKATWLTMHLLTIPWQYGLPLLLPLWQPRRWRARGPAAGDSSEPVWSPSA